jgi:hypothetical protein
MHDVVLSFALRFYFRMKVASQNLISPLNKASYTQSSTDLFVDGDVAPAVTQLILLKHTFCGVILSSVCFWGEV